MQQCPSACPFTQGDPNEHLYYEMPYYRYAVVIDANTANSATGVRPDGGSAYFLHVTVGAPTQGCVSIAESALVSLMRWLTPTTHPRILIGAAS
jgi:L,D-peptidoglycan transpeptidase YkuD (ErfK/YbiS/YcfS/YnhG family)